MLFSTIRFFIFLAIVLLLFYSAPRRLRRYILLLASYVFYASWNYKFIALLLVLTAIDYTAGIWLERVASPARRRLVLVGSLAANLAFLGFFKYFNFLAANLAHLLGRAPDSFALEIVLPLGISFHTFQSMSYVIDVYRGTQAAVRDPIDYALFICFFPQLVAGPIVRARDFFRDLLDWHRPSAEDVSRGVLLLAFGLTKKLAFADQFAKIANEYFGNVAAHPGMVPAWTGVFAFAMQIYFDFSGYTDMAIGIAKLLGFHFPVNFRRPYLALSITDFWRRWHISLSSWLRDYLYVPLGGNRHGRWQTYRNLMLTMLLGGLWHGASWNFVIWGGYQGALLAIERAVGAGDAGQAKQRWLTPLRWTVTFGLVLVGWVFFRAADLPQSMAILKQMFTVPSGRPLPERWQTGLAVTALLVAITEERWEWFDRLSKGPALAYATAFALTALVLEIFAVTDASVPFIYFQF
jgi:D-alanyl-lipoteichoic acid acyltransferase DltB (MBOAT superfamily)